METATFCRLNCGFRLKKINHQDFLLNRNHLQRKHSLPFSPLAELKPLRGGSQSLWPQRCSDKLMSPKLRFNGDSLKCRADLAVAPVEGGPDGEEEVVVIAKEKKIVEEEELSRATLIWRAAKLPMYTVALIPVTVASAAAYYQTGVFSLGRYLFILASYVIINLWVNLSNDVYDFDTGADKDKKESVVNLFGSRNGINFIAWSLLALGFSGLTWIAAGAGSLRAMVFIAAAVFGFYLYQCPPFRLSYYGVGEPLLFLAYGPFSTLGFYLLNSIKSELPISGTAVWSSILIGLTTSLILFCSHFHQIKGDKAVGKMSPLVRLGTETGSHVVKWSIIGLYTLVLVLGMTKTLPVASVLLCAMTLPMGGLVVNFVQKNHKDDSKIFMGKYFCVRLHTIFGAALAAGLVAARMLAKQAVVAATAL